MIRAAAPEDFPAIEAHSKLFWGHTYFDEAYKDGSALPYIELCHSHNLLLVAEVDAVIVGFAAGCKAQLMGDSSIIHGSELAWWVDEEHRGGRLGIQLLRGLELAAKAAGCSYWSMVYLESSMPDSIRKIYLKMGYQLNETVYGKRL